LIQSHHAEPCGAAIVVPLWMRTPAGVLSFFGTSTGFGAPLETTLSELVVDIILVTGTWAMWSTCHVLAPAGRT